MIAFEELSRALDRYRARKTGIEVIATASPVGRNDTGGAEAATTTQAYSATRTTDYAAVGTATYATATPVSLSAADSHFEVTRVQAAAPAALAATKSPSTGSPRATVPMVAQRPEPAVESAYELNAADALDSEDVALDDDLPLQERTAVNVAPLRQGYPTPTPTATSATVTTTPTFTPTMTPLDTHAPQATSTAEDAESRIVLDEDVELDDK